jgi:hypothetical protein
MAFIIKENQAGLPAIGSIGSASAIPLGTIVRADDPVYGSGEFIYLQGVANTVLGSAVSWSGVSGSNVPTFQTALLANTTLQGVSVAFATAAILANQFGWYQIGGVAVAATTGTFASAGPASIGAAGQLVGGVVAGKQILGATSLTANNVPGTNQVLLSCNRPMAQGPIT